MRIHDIRVPWMNGVLIILSTYCIAVRSFGVSTARRKHSRLSLSAREPPVSSFDRRTRRDLLRAESRRLVFSNSHTSFTRSIPRPSSSLHVLPHDFLVSWSDLATTTSHNAWTSYGELLRNHPISTKAITAGILAATGDAIAQFRTVSTTTDTNIDSTIETVATKFDYDARRGATFMLFGALYTGTFQHYWFTFLSSHIADWGHSLGIWGGPSPSSYTSYISDATTLLGPNTVDDMTAVSDLSSALANDEWWSYFDVMAQGSHAPGDAVLAAAKVAVNQFGIVPLVYMPLFFGVTGALGGLDVNQAVARARSLYRPLLTRNYFFWLPMQFVQFFVLPPEWQIPFVSMASLVWTIVLSSVGGLPARGAPQSQIVAYEPVEGDASSPDSVTVVLVDAGPVNALEDKVLIGEIRDALVPDDVTEAVKGVWTEAQGGAKGVALGLLASSAAEGSIGAAVGRLVNGEVGVGVALVTAVSAGVGIIAASNSVASASIPSDSAIETEKSMNGATNDFSVGYNVTLSDSDNNLIPDLLEALSDRNAKNPETLLSFHVASELPMDIEMQHRSGMYTDTTDIDNVVIHASQDAKDDVYSTGMPELEGVVVG